MTDSTYDAVAWLRRTWRNVEEELAPYVSAVSELVNHTLGPPNKTGKDANGTTPRDTDSRTSRTSK